MGLNAAGGNLGTGIVQLIVPTSSRSARASTSSALDWSSSLALLAAVLAWRGMDNLSGAKADYRSFANATRSRHTWIISFLYIGTFGSFIGYSGAFPTLLKASSPRPRSRWPSSERWSRRLTRPSAASSRTAWAAPASRSCPAAAGAGCPRRDHRLQQHSFVFFFASFMVLFTGAGIGNGATYHAQSRRSSERASLARAAVRRPQGRDRGASASPRPSVRTAASSSPAGSRWPRSFRVARPALWVFVAAYLVMAAVTYAVYARRGAGLAAERV